MLNAKFILVEVVTLGILVRAMPGNETLGDHDGIFKNFFCRYKNNHIAPTEIEEVLFSHPAVLEAIVFGRPCDEVQELVCAFVVKRPGFEVG